MAAPATRKAAITWFPGHMAKASRELQEKLKRVDLVLEVRDARIPLSSANKQLEDMTCHKLKILVLNKRDLADMSLEERWTRHFASAGTQALFASADQPNTIKKVLRAVRAELQAKRAAEDTLLAMVVGVPNVGKSAIINALHRAAVREGVDGVDSGRLKSAKVGPLPGVTRRLQAFKVGSRPSAYVLDTPGIMMPRIEDEEVGLKLALTGAIKDSVVGEVRLANFLSHLISRHQSPQAAGADGEELLLTKEQGKADVPEIEDGDLLHAQRVLMTYRAGKLGTWTWDRVPTS